MDPVFDPHHRFGHGPAPDPQRRFDDARWAANVNQLVRMLAHQRTTLVPFDDVRSRLESAPVIPRGTQIIPLDSVVGSVERYHDFTGEFLPRNEELRARWQRLDQATRRMETIPPIDVYKLGDLYFVRDGNHRVSVARFNRLAHIEANVTEIPVKVALTPDMNVNQIILGAERSDFLSRTRLDELRPDNGIEFTAPGRYEEAQEHIDVHRWHLGVERNAEIPHSEAVTSWYDNVYLPAIAAIDRAGLLACFPNRTSADLYLWTMRHLAELQEEYSKWVDTRMAAADLAREHAGNPVQKVARTLKKKTQALLGRDEVPPIIEDLLDKLEEQERAAGEFPPGEDGRVPPDTKT